MTKYMLGPDNPVPPSPCTNCGAIMRVANNLSERGDGRPDPGDVTVCIECHHLMIFDVDLRLRDLTADEIKRVAGDERLRVAMWALGELKRRMKGKQP